MKKFRIRIFLFFSSTRERASNEINSNKRERDFECNLLTLICDLISERLINVHAKNTHYFLLQSSSFHAD